MASPCSPLHIFFALYRSTPLADQCALLAVRDGVLALLRLGSCALFWTTKNKHTLEFAAFQLALCIIGWLLWLELLALALVNCAVYIVVDKTADVCALLFGLCPASEPRHDNAHPVDPARIRICSTVQKQI